MDSTTDNIAKQPADTQFPTADKPAAGVQKPSDNSAAQAASPAADDLLKRMTQRAHDVVDSVSDRIASKVDGLQGGIAHAGETRDEWVESAREAIRQHPFAAIGTAVLIGLALRSLSSSRDR